MAGTVTNSWKKIALQNTEVVFAGVSITGSLSGSSTSTEYLVIDTGSGQIQSRALSLPANLISGTGTAGQVAYFDTTGSIAGDAGFTYTANTDTLTVGNLIVNGTTTTIDTTNLTVEDAFILVGSGQGGTIDGGIVVATGAVSGSEVGAAFAFDKSAFRWVVQGAVSETATNVSSGIFQVTATNGASGPGTNPDAAVAGGATGYGNMHVNTSTGEVFIWVGEVPVDNTAGSGPTEPTP